VRTAGLAAAGGVVAAGAAAWELQRRRDLRDVEDDPLWHELNRPLQGRSRQVRSADGTRLHAEVFGAQDAAPLVLVHGWTESIALWHHQIRDLSTEFRVIAYDQRGHGRSAVPDDADSYTADSLAADLDAVLHECIGPSEPFVVGGHSMGGMTLVAWAGRHPGTARERLAGALFVSTGMSELVARALLFGPLAGARARQVLARPLQARTRLPKNLTPLGYRALRWAAFGRHVEPGSIAFLHRMVVECPAPVRAGFGRLFPTLDLTESVQHVSAPAVVIVGERDRLLPPWHGQQLASHLPRLDEHVELRGIGHMAPLEAPEEVTSRLRRLGRGLQGARGREPERALA
jgi:pimeloyl-ACP methyl ester carboxylesterase